MFGKVTRKNEPFNQTSMYVSKYLYSDTKV